MGHFSCFFLLFPARSLFRPVCAQSDSLRCAEFDCSPLTTTAAPTRRADVSDVANLGRPPVAPPRPRGNRLIEAISLISPISPISPLSPPPDWAPCLSPTRVAADREPQRDATSRLCVRLVRHFSLFTPRCNKGRPPSAAGQQTKRQGAPVARWLAIGPHSAPLLGGSHRPGLVLGSARQSEPTKRLSESAFRFQVNAGRFGGVFCAPIGGRFGRWKSSGHLEARAALAPPSGVARAHNGRRAGRTRRGGPRATRLCGLTC